VYNGNVCVRACGAVGTSVHDLVSTVARRREGESAKRIGRKFDDSCIASGVSRLAIRSTRAM